MLFFTPRAEANERPRDGRDADRQAVVLFEAGAQFFERGVLPPPHPRIQLLLVARQQARRVTAAVRARGDILAAPVQVEQSVDEGGADAEEFGRLADGAVAAQGGG
jgi:hypothetical protein